MVDNYLHNARKDKSLIHKLFLFIPIVGDLLPFILLFLNPIFHFNANWNHETNMLAIRIWAFSPAAVGLIIICIIVLYFVVWKGKSFSNYAFIGIAFSIIGCLEPLLLLYILLLGFRSM